MSGVIEKAVIDANGNKEDIVTRFGHEHISGWKLWEQNPRGFITEYEYDSLGRITKIIEPNEKGNNPVTTIEYNDVELYSITTDPLLNRTKYDYDDFGQLIEQIQYRSNGSVAARTRLSYDPWGNIIATTDPNNQTTNYEYDALGHNTRIRYPAIAGVRAEKCFLQALSVTKCKQKV